MSTYRQTPYGPQPNDRVLLKRKCRLLQSWYRVKIAKQAECGPWREGAEIVGSAIVNGRVTGANFLSAAAREYAIDKIDEKQGINRDLTIDEYRLFNNMLSSHPMCFNLFSDLRQGALDGVRNASEVLGAMLSEDPIAVVTNVEIEFLPQPKEEYINDKTALDAVIQYADANGQAGIVSIETKYTDKLGRNGAKNDECQKRIADEIGLLNAAGRDWYRTHPFDQIVRNLLLTIVFARKHNCAHARNYVLAPAEDSESIFRIESIRKKLDPKFEHSIRFLSLENAISQGLHVANEEFASLLERFGQRYLDFSPIADLL